MVVVVGLTSFASCQNTAIQVLLQEIDEFSKGPMKDKSNPLKEAFFHRLYLIFRWHLTVKN
jgi:hypothetical protein